MIMSLTESNKIIRKHQDRLPVPVVKLAGALGATVYTVSDWPDETSGMIRRDLALGGDQGYVIYVNKQHSPNRQRFTIAHEIAHIVLHADLIGNGITTDGMYRSGLPSSVEWAANRFAGNILMPRHKIEERMAKGITSLKALAREFQVSKEAMAIQLDWPWAWQWDAQEREAAKRELISNS